MLIVKPIEDKKIQEEVCTACGAVYDPDALAYAAREDEALIGVCQFRLGAGCADVLDLKAAAGVNDYEGMFILARGTLNFIDLCGVHSAFYSGKQPDDKLLRAIGFTQDENGVYTINLEGFFTDHCHNHSESKNKS